MRPERFRGAEAAGVVDRSNVCKGGHRPDAGDRHQARTYEAHPLVHALGALRASASATDGVHSLICSAQKS